MKFQTQYDRHPVPEENRFSPSKTIPNQSMTVQEIVQRFAQGLPFDQQRVPVYHGEETFLPDPKTLDLVEIADLKAQNEEQIKKLQKQAQDEKKPKIKQKTLAEEIIEAQDEIDKKKSSKDDKKH